METEIRIKQDLVEKFGLKPPILEHLEAFTHELIHWNKKINLISCNEVNRLWSRHIMDSLGLWSIVQKDKTLGDIGSGGGFPAIPIAILAKQFNPEMHITLVEADRRKAAFLTTITTKLGLRISIKPQRVEHCSAFQVESLSARAFASVDSLLRLMKKSKITANRFVLLKGKQCHTELALAAKNHSIEYNLAPHSFHKDSHVLILRLK